METIPSCDNDLVEEVLEFEQPGSGDNQIIGDPDFS
jgi:hypothetical protein